VLFFCDVRTEFLKIVHLIYLILAMIKFVIVNGFRLSADFCRHNNEPSISMAAGFFLDWVNDYQLVEKDVILWSY